MAQKSPTRTRPSTIGIVPRPARPDVAGHAWAATPARSANLSMARLRDWPDGGPLTAHNPCLLIYNLPPTLIFTSQSPSQPPLSFSLTFFFLTKSRTPENLWPGRQGPPCSLAGGLHDPLACGLHAPLTGGLWSAPCATRSRRWAVASRASLSPPASLRAPPSPSTSPHHRSNWI